MAAATLFGATAEPIEDAEPGTHLETLPAPTPHAPESATSPSFFSTGVSLEGRPARPHTPHLALGDVAAAVELGVMAADDAGAIAEERGAPGDVLVASKWRPSAEAPASGILAYLAHRFGDDPRRLHLIVDHRRTFEIGALVYSNATKPDPARAIGVIVETAPVGGIALIAKSAFKKKNMRLIVETEAGPSPARPNDTVAEPLS
jgi:hypothetical protein